MVIPTEVVPGVYAEATAHQGPARPNNSQSHSPTRPSPQPLHMHSATQETNTGDLSQDFLLELGISNVSTELKPMTAATATAVPATSTKEEHQLPVPEHVSSFASFRSQLATSQLETGTGTETVQIEDTNVPLGKLRISIDLTISEVSTINEPISLLIKPTKTPRRVLEAAVTHFNNQGIPLLLRNDWVIYYPRLNIYTTVNGSFSTLLKLWKHLSVSRDVVKDIWTLRVTALVLPLAEADQMASERERRIQEEMLERNLEREKHVHVNLVEVVVNPETLAESDGAVHTVRILKDGGDLQSVAASVSPLNNVRFTFDPALDEYSEGMLMRMHAVPNVEVDVEEAADSAEEEEQLEIEQQPTQEEVHPHPQFQQEETSPEHFTIILLLSDNRRLKLSVQHTTTISQVQQYVQDKTGATGVALFFDDEEMTGTLEQYELEEDDLVEVRV